MGNVSKLIAVLFFLLADSASASVTVCNDSKNKIMFSLAWHAADHWHSRGWFTATPYKCTKIIDNLNVQFYWIYATSKDDTWSGNKYENSGFFCTSNQKFFYIDANKTTCNGHSFIRTDTANSHLCIDLCGTGCDESNGESEDSEAVNFPEVEVPDWCASHMEIFQNEQISDIIVSKCRQDNCYNIYLDEISETLVKHIKHVKLKQSGIFKFSEDWKERAEPLRSYSVQANCDPANSRVIRADGSVIDIPEDELSSHDIEDDLAIWKLVCKDVHEVLE
ncbi:DUF1036 domain-containing protein [Methylocella sp.]|uniref:DUF1036 domain-containing protein n=1 Tax=Methylocella sp. TaxID=1978226 RepID=UPI00378434BB